MQRVLYSLAETTNATPVIIRILKRRHELNNLITWAGKKRLKAVQAAYINRLGDEEKRYLRATLHYPRLTRFLTVLHALWGILASTPRYFPKDSAAKYRSRNLTQTYNLSYSQLQIT
jgi:hypothetical protein